jgi:hypothetical protein
VESRFQFFGMQKRDGLGSNDSTFSPSLLKEYLHVCFDLNTNAMIADVGE